MLFKFLVISFTLLPFLTFSQKQKTSEITAEGKSRAKEQPDVAILTFTVEKKDTIETKAIERLNLEIGKLVEVLSKLGFDKKTIKVADRSFKTITGSQ